MGMRVNNGFFVAGNTAGSTSVFPKRDYLALSKSSLKNYLDIFHYFLILREKILRELSNAQVVISRNNHQVSLFQSSQFRSDVEVRGLVDDHIYLLGHVPVKVVRVVCHAFVASKLAQKTCVQCGIIGLAGNKFARFKATFVAELDECITRIFFLENSIRHANKLPPLARKISVIDIIVRHIRNSVSIPDWSAFFNVFDALQRFHFAEQPLHAFRACAQNLVPNLINHWMIPPY